MTSRRSARNLVTFAALAVLLTGCTVPSMVPAPEKGQSPVAARPVAAPAQPAAAPATPAATPAAAAEVKTAARVEYVGKMSLEPKTGPAGTRVTVTGSGLPANKEFQVVWNTARGSWILKGKYQNEFHGREFADVALPLTTARTDDNGNLKSGFTVPEGWGFDHDVTLVETETGMIRNQANFSVNIKVAISPTSGPPGTPITVTVTGIGYMYMFNSWVLTYDNMVTGWLSSVTTGGKATAVIPASGRPGKHLLQVSHGWTTVSYLNPLQSPYPEKPIIDTWFTVTDEPPALPPAATSQGLKPEVGAPPPGSGPAIWTSLASAPVGTPVRLLGRGLPPGQEVELLWYRMVGSRVTAQGFSEESGPLARARTGSDGSLAYDFKVPDDLGGSHTIEARLGEKVLASGRIIITPSAFAVEPARGPAGTTFKVHLKGVGWTETANIYTMTYDNAYVGFACAFNSQGDVEIFVTATGDPGWHFIDLYPAIYKGQDVKGTVNFRYPQLTAAEDHPGERLPIFRLAFEITK